MAATVGLIVVLSLIMIFSLIANACGSGKTDAEHKPTTDIQTMANIAESGITKVPKEHLVSIGKYKLTAYCPCEHCCDKWGKDRPKDKDGKPIVITASGEIANQGITVAADTSVLPFGTRIQIDGCEYIVQDRGGSVKGNTIDIYFENHQDAVNFGVQYKEIYIVERIDEND
jgi:3D (Asp-Asp-Asp) domain-containing protein